MAGERFWQSRYEQPISQFVPLPLDFMKGKIEQDQGQRDQATQLASSFDNQLPINAIQQYYDPTAVDPATGKQGMMKQTYAAKRAGEIQQQYRSKVDDLRNQLQTGTIDNTRDIINNAIQLNRWKTDQLAQTGEAGRINQGYADYTGNLAELEKNRAEGWSGDQIAQAKMLAATQYGMGENPNDPRSLAYHPYQLNKYQDIPKWVDERMKDTETYMDNNKQYYSAIDPSSGIKTWYDKDTKKEIIDRERLLQQTIEGYKNSPQIQGYLQNAMQLKGYSQNLWGNDLDQYKQKYSDINQVVQHDDNGKILYDPLYVDDHGHRYIGANSVPKGVKIVYQDKQPRLLGDNPLTEGINYGLDKHSRYHITDEDTRKGYDEFKLHVATGEWDRTRDQSKLTYTPWGTNQPTIADFTNNVKQLTDAKGQLDGTKTMLNSSYDHLTNLMNGNTNAGGFGTMIRNSMMNPELVRHLTSNVDDKVSNILTNYTKGNGNDVDWDKYTKDHPEDKQWLDKIDDKQQLIQDMSDHNNMRNQMSQQTDAYNQQKSTIEGITKGFESSKYVPKVDWQGEYDKYKYAIDLANTYSGENGEKINVTDTNSFKNYIMANSSNLDNTWLSRYLGSNKEPTIAALKTQMGGLASDIHKGLEAYMADPNTHTAILAETIKGGGARDELDKDVDAHYNTDKSAVLMSQFDGGGGKTILDYLHDKGYISADSNDKDQLMKEGLKWMADKKISSLQQINMTHGRNSRAMTIEGKDSDGKSNISIPLTVFSDPNQEKRNYSSYVQQLKTNQATRGNQVTQAQQEDDFQTKKQIAASGVVDPMTWSQDVRENKPVMHLERDFAVKDSNGKIIGYKPGFSGVDMPTREGLDYSLVKVGTNNKGEGRFKLLRRSGNLYKDSGFTGDASTCKAGMGEELFTVASPNVDVQNTRANTYEDNLAIQEAKRLAQGGEDKNYINTTGN